MTGRRPTDDTAITVSLEKLLPWRLREAGDTVNPSGIG